MTEKEKMIAGKIYDPADSELLELRALAHRLSAEYNLTFETETEKRAGLMNRLVPKAANGVYLQGPVQFDYGCFTEIGENSYANFNLTVLDCAPVKIGKNVFIGPNVSILTPVHPLRFQDRNMYRRADGVMTDREYAKPITICDNCWIAGNVTICGGVTIGEGTVIGAGSVVTRDIPAGAVAAGVPCRKIRDITDADGELPLI
ncbi:MAG: sugar O-acetyltransferase [Ruminiclostridium sp.]|nr:sugar O-acetyltransferase [Ruminiclostridium sp.]